MSIERMRRLIDSTIVTKKTTVVFGERLPEIRERPPPTPSKSGFKSANRAGLELRSTGVPVSEKALETLILLTRRVKRCQGAGPFFLQIFHVAFRSVECRGGSATERMIVGVFIVMTGRLAMIQISNTRKVLAVSLPRRYFPDRADAITIPEDHQVLPEMGGRVRNSR